jgi:hypothetical protein
MVQIAGIDPIRWGRVVTIGEAVRPFSTMGHPNFLGAFLVMAFPILVYFARHGAERRQWLATASFGVAAVLAGAAILVSASRGSWLALVGVVGALTAGWFLSGARASAAVVAVLCVIAGGGVGVLVLASGSDELGGVLGSVADRLRHLAESPSRQHIWRASLALFGDHPLLGTGLDTFQAAFAALITWHRGKAGTIEPVHRVLKDELGAGVMPCQLFGANAAWFRINVLTFNLLTALKRLALPECYRLARPKRLRFEVFTLPGKLAVHESQLSVQVSAADARRQELVAARQRLLQQLESTPA